MSIRINKIYTRQGDAGSTRSIEGELVSKNSLRVHAFGEVDELNAFVGIARTRLIERGKSDSKNSKEAGLAKSLLMIQHHLFDLGGLVATEKTSPEKQFPSSRVTHLEQLIDECTQDLPELRSFVLPGGNLSNADFHLCRTVCRRVERGLIALHEQAPLPLILLVYINRLSDLFFAYSRWVSFLHGDPEVLWEPGKH